MPVSHHHHIFCELCHRGRLEPLRYFFLSVPNKTMVRGRWSSIGEGAWVLAVYVLWFGPFLHSLSKTERLSNVSCQYWCPLMWAGAHCIVWGRLCECNVSCQESQSRDNWLSNVYVGQIISCLMWIASHIREWWPRSWLYCGTGIIAKPLAWWYIFAREFATVRQTVRGSSRSDGLSFHSSRAGKAAHNPCGGAILLFKCGIGYHYSRLIPDRFC
jgi:hypothetical protein